MEGEKRENGEVGIEKKRNGGEWVTGRGKEGKRKK